METRLWQLLVNGADEVLVLGIFAYIGFLLLRIAVNRYFDYLEKQTPKVERVVEGIEKLARTAERLTEMFADDHRVLFGSIRGLQWELRQMRDPYGSAETSEKP